jgi:predicted amidohydrolase YtcJ
MPSSESWTVHDVRVGGAVLDCRIRDGVISELGPNLAYVEGEQRLDGAGGELVPGLADHHIHLRALAAAKRSIDLAGAALETALDAPGTGPLRIVGAAHGMTRSELDALWLDRAVRVQHRSGALWVLNSAALQLLDSPATAQERDTGQFWRSPPRLAVPADDDAAALRGIGAELASRGVTHVTDATAHDGDPSMFRVVDQHVLALSPGGAGPLKIVVPDHRRVDLAELSHQVEGAHASGRGVAVHAVTAAALALAIAALTEVGVHPADRIEHAAVCGDAAAAQLARLAVPVVTQPTVYAKFADRFRQESEPQERDLLWRYAGLRDAGVAVVASSDAPFGDADPWATVHAAACALPAPERVDAAVALNSMLTSADAPAAAARQVRSGAPADLCLLAGSVAATLDRVVRGADPGIAATFIGGRLAYRA